MRDIAVTAINIIKDLPETNEPERDISYKPTPDRRDGIIVCDHYKKGGKSIEFVESKKKMEGNRVSRQYSPKRREKNPDFFKGKGKKGDIEIFTKSPVRESKELLVDQQEYDPSIHVYVPQGRNIRHEYEPQSDKYESNPQME